MALGLKDAFLESPWAFAVAAALFFAEVFALCSFFFAKFLYGFNEPLPCHLAIARLGTGLLGNNRNAKPGADQSNCRAGLVDVLAAGAGGSGKPLDDVLRVDTQLQQPWQCAIQWLPCDGAVSPPCWPVCRRLLCPQPPARRSSPWLCPSHQKQWLPRDPCDARAVPSPRQ